MTELDLKTLDLPLYDQDIQDAGLPESVQQLKRMVEASEMVMIASPEYNYSIPGVLKNALDWGSRLGNSWNGKTTVLFGVSNGRYATVRGQFHLRQSITALNMLALPQPMVLVPNGDDAFTPDGEFVDPTLTERLKKLIAATLAITPAFQASLTLSKP